MRKFKTILKHKTAKDNIHLSVPSTLYNWGKVKISKNAQAGYVSAEEN